MKIKFTRFSENKRFKDAHPFGKPAIIGRAGIHTVILGLGGKGMHAAVEYVNLHDVFDCAAIIAQDTANWVR